MGKLTATGARALTAPGRYNDGDGLELLIGRTGAKSWVVRVQKDGKRRDIGAGSFKKVSLADARKRAEKIRAMIEAGIDPVLERRKEKGVPTFRLAAASVHAEQKKGWKNGKHIDQWINTLTTYAFPAFGDVSVAGIDAAAVRDVLAAIWLTKPETARRLRQRIRTVIDWSVGKGYREASLAWPVIDKALPKQRAKVIPRPSLPYSELPAFLSKLREREAMGRLALEALILTACRSAEVRGALWTEIDLEAQLWRIPAGRMKRGVDHTIPLCDASVAHFRRMKAHKRENNDLVFPGPSKGKELSDMTLTKLVRDMHAADLKAGGLGFMDPVQNRIATAHGFRSTFADWVNEQTSFPREVREAALAHVNQNKVEAAYSRTAYLDKRRPMMVAWADYCTGSTGGNVVRLAV